MEASYLHRIHSVRKGDVIPQHSGVAERPEKAWAIPLKASEAVMCSSTFPRANKRASAGKKMTCLADELSLLFRLLKKLTVSLTQRKYTIRSLYNRDEIKCKSSCKLTGKLTGTTIFLEVILLTKKEY